MTEIWHKFEGTADNKKFRPKTEKEELRNLNSKLSSLYGYISAARSDVDNNFREVYRLLMQQQDYLYSIKNKSELYFYITVILFFFSFGQQQFGEIPSFIPIFSDQNIWKILQL